MSVIERYKNWFETEVANQIPHLVKAYLELSGADMSEYNDWLKDSMLYDKGCTYTELHYILMDEPYVAIDMDFDSYIFCIRIADQMCTRMKFETNELTSFIRYWNAVVVEYYGDDSARLPIMPNFIS